MSQRVELESIEALVAFAVEIVRLGDAIAVDEQDLHDLGAVVLSGEHDGRDVGRELSVVGRGRLPERVRVAVHELLLVEHLVLGMSQDRLGYLCVAQVDGEQEGLFHFRRVRPTQQGLHDLEMFVLDRETKCRAAEIVGHVDVKVLDGLEYARHGRVVAILARVHEPFVDVRLFYVFN